MNDITERLKSHADWLESAGQSKVQAHLSPDKCQQAAEDIREAIKALDARGAPAFIITHEMLDAPSISFGPWRQQGVAAWVQHVRQELAKTKPKQE